MIRRVVVRVPVEVHSSMKAIAAQEETTVQEIVTQLITGYVRKHAPKAAKKLMKTGE